MNVVIKKTNIEGVSISSLFHYDIYKKFKYKKQKIGNFHFLENCLGKVVSEFWKMKEKQFYIC